MRHQEGKQSYISHSQSSRNTFHSSICTVSLQLEETIVTIITVITVIIIIVIIKVMDRVEADLTPGEDWRESLNATCNRLSTQYLNLLRAASSMSSLEQKGGISNNNGNNNKGAGSSSNFGSGSQKMTSLQDPPPPPLAADIGSSSLQCQLAVENLCVASSQLLSLIRTLRLSILMMDEETIAAEEEWQVLEVQKITNQAQNEANKLEQEWMELRNQEFAVVDDDNNNN